MAEVMSDLNLRQRPLPAPARFSAAVHPVLQRIYAARGLQQDSELGLLLAGLLPPSALHNMTQAVQLLLDCLQVQKRVLIVADFDADGATSCALALLCLRAFGFAHVDYLVPNRFTYGYGLTPEIVEVARERAPDLIITVDNGIASHEGIALANRCGIAVLVTDHHLPANTLPAAACILNPNQPGCTFPSKALAGVGVVFYLMTALRAALREQQWFVRQQLKEPNMLAYLDLVALGTVADVVPLDANNRCLVKHGLQVIRSGRARPGIQMLLEVAGRNPAAITAADLGFAVGPRLNAAGRLDDMSHGIECLLCEDLYTARSMALELDGLNKDRKLIEQDMQTAALAHLDSLALAAEDRLSICLYDPAWHQGVSGILASRIKERLHRPVLIFADAGSEADGTAIIKGSARSIPGLHIRDLLDAVATRNPGLLSKFGGHAMAAGLSLRREDFTAFSIALEREVQAQADPELFVRETLSDGELEPGCFSLEFATLLQEGGPWGQHFPEPLFHGEFALVSSRVLGDKHRKMVLGVPGTSLLVDAIAFNLEPALLTQQGERVCLLYKLDVNEFRGQRSVQLLVEKLAFC
jgi:single-stranded-DNA-specific exonuclease